MSKAKAVVLVIIAALLAGYFVVLRLLMPGILQQMMPLVQKTAAEYVNGKINIGALHMSDSLKLTADDVAIYDKEGRVVAIAPSVTINFDLLRGLFKADPIKAVSIVNVNQPVLYLHMDDKEHWNIKDVIKQKEPGKTSFVGLVRINSGRSEVATPFGQWDIGVDGTIDAAPNPQFDSNLVLSYEKENWKIAGRVDAEAKGYLFLKTEHFDIKAFSNLAKRYTGIDQLTGSIKDLNLRWSGDGKDIALEGAGYLDKVAAVAAYREEQIPIVVDGKVSFHEKTAEAVNLDFTAGGEKGRINGKLDLSHVSEPVAKDLAVELFAFDLKKAWEPSPVDGKVTGMVTINGIRDDFTANGVMSSDVLTVGGQTFTNVQVPVAAQNKKIVIPGAKTEYGGGGIFLFGEYAWSTGELAAAIEVENANIGPAIGLSGENAILSGDFALTGTAKGESGKLNAVGKLAELRWNGDIFKDFRLDVDYDKDKIVVNNLSGYCNEDGSLAAQGSIVGGEISAQARIANFSMKPFLHMAGQEGYGKFSGTFTVSGSKAAPRVVGEARMSDGEILKQKFKDAHGFFLWQDNKLKIDDLKVTMPAGEHLVNGLVDLGGGEPVVDLKILTKGIRVEPLAEAVAKDYVITGNLDNEVTVKGRISSPEVFGRMNFYEGSVNKYLIDDAVGEYSYLGGNLYLKNFLIHALQTEAHLDGTIYNNRDLDFVMTARKVDLKRLAIPEKVTVSGLVDLQGSIKGTLSSPLFLGELNSSSVIINGQEFTAINGKVESTAGRVNKLKASAQQGGGYFEIDMLLDFGAALLQGTVEAKGGNMKSMLALAGQDYDIEGDLDGSIVVNKGGKGTGISVGGQIRNCSVRGIRYKSAVFDVFIHNDVLRIINMRAEEETLGFMAAQGTIDFRNRDLALEMFCSDANAALLTAFMKNPVDFGGKMGIAAQINGTIEKPEANASLSISQGQVAGTSFDNLYGMFTLRDDVYKIEQLFIQKDIYKASAYGVLPHDLFRAKAERKNPDAQMAIQVRLDNANLAILPMLTKNVESSSGETSGGLMLTGTLEEPLVDGTFNINNGTVKLKQMSTLIENLKLAVKFEGRRLRLEELSAKIGPNGRLASNGTFALIEDTANPYELNVTASNVEVASPLFSGTINGKGTVVQKRDRPHITGEVRLDKVLINMPTVPEITEGGPNIGLDLKIELGPEIHLYNKYLYDLWLAGGLHIMGSTRYTNVDGSVVATKGTVSYLRTPFKIRKAKAGFPTPGSILPTISLDSYAKFGRYNVAMNIEGPLDQMELKLSSDPPLSQQELFRMLTLRSYAYGNGSDNGLGKDDLQGMLDVGLEMTFLRDVETLFREELNLDQFRVYSGNTASGIGFEINAKDSSEFTQEEREQYNILVGKNLSDNVTVGYAASLEGQYYIAFTQYGINDNITLNFSLDEEQKKWYGIEYHISF